MSQNILWIFYLFKKIKTTVSLKAVQSQWQLDVNLWAIICHPHPKCFHINGPVQSSPLPLWEVLLLSCFPDEETGTERGSSLPKVAQLMNDLNPGVFDSKATPRDLAGTDSHCVLQCNPFRSLLRSSSSPLSPLAWEREDGPVFSKNHEDSKSFTIYLLSISGFCSIDHFSTFFLLIPSFTSSSSSCSFLFHE